MRTPLTPDLPMTSHLFDAIKNQIYVVYHKGQLTATPILIYKDTKREVVQQCIANLMSQLMLNHYDHSEVIADLYTRQFEDKLRHLCPLDKANRLRCFK